MTVPTTITVPRPPGPDLGSEAEVTRLVHDFYARVRADAQLGPVFDAHVDDWPAHLATLVDFWSAMLRGTRRFRGAPMQKHMVIAGMDAALFRRWLALFADSTAALGNPDMQQQADDMAARIAETFWQRYQMQRGEPAPTGL